MSSSLVFQLRPRPIWDSFIVDILAELSEIARNEKLQAVWAAFDDLKLTWTCMQCGGVGLAAAAWFKEMHPPVTLESWVY